MIDTRFYTLAKPQSLRDIATICRVDLPVDGAGDEIILAPASLFESQSGEITFFSDKRRRAQLETAKATACFTTERLAPLVIEKGMIALVTDNPRGRFARLTQTLATEGTENSGPQAIHETSQIHPSAIIGAGVSVGANTKIGPHAVIDEGVIIGEDCQIGPLTHIAFTIMGDRCSVKSSTVIGGSGFGIAEDEHGLFNIPHLGRVVIHNDVHIGSNSCVDRGQLGDTVLMDHVKIDNLVQVGHNVFIDEGAMLAGHTGVSGSCRIGKKALFGGRAATADHVNIGEGSILAAFGGAMSDIPDGEMWSGVPAMPIREHMRNVATLKKLSKK
ncbi:UDP-3-O-(3-hydroxymyristoyl)glucosamine N-acyltransferase [Litorimonas sp. WD9-15]|uniref:UDP-3-O-(3-hydroxymyristoyl)glucosamine N-acyltransferase n=1 Tax=Litorimonas sp. WD9-15 TaxID=3418716 RepID=UPI003CFE9CD9